MTTNWVRNISRLKDKFTKTDFQRKLHSCTSNDLSFPPQEDLNTVARHTFYGNEYQMIVDHLTQKLMDSDAKKWRKVIKAQQLLEICLRNGHKRMREDFKKQMYTLNQLETYQMIENGMDRGKAIRDQTKKVIKLVLFNPDAQNEDHVPAVKKNNFVHNDSSSEDESTQKKSQKDITKSKPKGQIARGKYLEEREEISHHKNRKPVRTTDVFQSTELDDLQKALKQSQVEFEREEVKRSIMDDIQKHEENLVIQQSVLDIKKKPQQKKTSQNSNFTKGFLNYDAFEDDKLDNKNTGFSQNPPKSTNNQNTNFSQNPPKPANISKAKPGETFEWSSDEGDNQNAKTEEDLVYNDYNDYMKPAKVTKNNLVGDDKLYKFVDPRKVNKAYNTKKNVEDQDNRKKYDELSQGNDYSGYGDQNVDENGFNFSNPPKADKNQKNNGFSSGLNDFGNFNKSDPWGDNQFKDFNKQKNNSDAFGGFGNDFNQNNYSDNTNQFGNFGKAAGFGVTDTNKQKNHNNSVPSFDFSNHGNSSKDTAKFSQFDNNNFSQPANDNQFNQFQDNQYKQANQIDGNFGQRANANNLDVNFQNQFNNMNVRSHSPDIPKLQDYNNNWNASNKQPDYENASNFAREPQIVQSLSSPFDNNNLQSPIESFVVNQNFNNKSQNQPVEDELI